MAQPNVILFIVKYSFLFPTSSHVNLLLFNPILPTFSNIIIHIDHFHANKKMTTECHLYINSISIEFLLLRIALKIKVTSAIKIIEPIKAGKM